MLRRLGRLAWRVLPFALIALAVALVADEALAQRTGGSFGGGSFGGGGGGGSSSGGGSSYSGDDGGDGILTFVIWILVSRLPWPLKIGLVVLVGGGWVAFKLVQRHRRDRSDDD